MCVEKDYLLNPVFTFSSYTRTWFIEPSTTKTKTKTKTNKTKQKNFKLKSDIQLGLFR
jgi:hypothetical protein